MIYRGRVFENDEVKPAASSSPSRGDSYLTTLHMEWSVVEGGTAMKGEVFYDFLQFRADVPMLFCEEWSTSYASHIALDDADHIPDFERTNP